MMSKRTPREGDLRRLLQSRPLGHEQISRGTIIGTSDIGTVLAIGGVVPSSTAEPLMTRPIYHPHDQSFAGNHQASQARSPGAVEPTRPTTQIPWHS